MVFQNYRNKMLFFVVLFLLTVSTLSASLYTVVAISSTSTGEIENPDVTLTSAPRNKRICCKTALCQMDKFQAGIVDECMQELIEQHLANCRHCARVYLCESH